jgi:dihydroorotate dehydrogenase electron transfer subunit
MGIHDVEADLVKILIEPVGKGTRVLSGARVGDHYSVLGPLGNGFDLAGDGPALVIGGGIGAAPLALLVRRLKENRRDVRCLLGFRTRRQAVAAELFGGIEMDICTEDGTMGRKAIVSELLAGCLADLGSDAASAQLYACGPDAMMQAVIGAAHQCGADAQVSVVAHMACGVGACQGCVVRAGGEYRRACNEGPVFRAGELEWR